MVSIHGRSPRTRTGRGLRMQGYRRQQKEQKDNAASNSGELQPSNDSPREPVAIQEKRTDRTLSLRTNLSRDGSFRTIEERCPSFLSAAPIGTSTDRNKEPLLLAPPMAITHKDKNSEAVEAETVNRQVDGYYHVKTRLRSKVLKSKMSNRRRGEGESETIDGEHGGSNANRLIAMKRYPSQVKSARSDTTGSSMHTPKITNRAKSKQRMFSTFDRPAEIQLKEESNESEDEAQSKNLDNEKKSGTWSRSSIPQKMSQTSFQLYDEGDDSTQRTRDSSFLGFTHVIDWLAWNAADDSSVDTFDSMSTGKILRTHACCGGTSALATKHDLTDHSSVSIQDELSNPESVSDPEEDVDRKKAKLVQRMAHLWVDLQAIQARDTSSMDRASE